MTRQSANRPEAVGCRPQGHMTTGGSLKPKRNGGLGMASEGRLRLTQDMGAQRLWPDPSAALGVTKGAVPRSG